MGHNIRFKGEIWKITLKNSLLPLSGAWVSTAGNTGVNSEQGGNCD